MAYSATVTVTPVTATSWRGYILTIAETEAAASSETEIVLADAGLPAMGRIITQRSRLTAGTGTTIDPVLGNQTNPAAGDWLVENDTAAAAVHNVPAAGIPYGSDITSFFHRAVPNDATADHSITTTYYIVSGWGDR